MGTTSMPKKNTTLEVGHDHSHKRRHRRRHGDLADYFFAIGAAPAWQRIVEPVCRHRTRNALLVAGSFDALSAGRERVDERALGRLVDAAYQEAGLTPRDIDTGAIILTGEAIRRDNARAIADLFAAQRGNFVCATAGHNFEALLAAHGSGAVAFSAERRCRVLNIDIGGGTTKLAVAECGRVSDRGVPHRRTVVGYRWRGHHHLLEPGGQALARQAASPGDWASV